MWLLVVSFCHMLKISADLILLKGGVLVRWGTCLLYILFFFFFSHAGPRSAIGRAPDS